MFSLRRYTQLKFTKNQEISFHFFKYFNLIDLFHDYKELNKRYCLILIHKDEKLLTKLNFIKRQFNFNFIPNRFLRK